VIEHALRRDRKSMERDNERISWVQSELARADLDAIVCSLPQHVLMLSGYFPVVGTSVAVVTQAGQVHLIVPADEKQLAHYGWADRVSTFEPGSLKIIASAAKAVLKPLQSTLRGLELTRARIGFETGPAFEPASYVAEYFYLGAIRRVLQGAVPKAKLSSARRSLRHLRSVLTGSELSRLRLSCKVAQLAFEQGAHQIRTGMMETEVGALFTSPLKVDGMKIRSVHRAGGEAFCMSGPNSAEASAAYAQSRSRILKRNDLVLVHCNSHVDGYWTDITRTYLLGEPDRRKRKIYEAIFEARAAALAAIRPGVTGAEVDHAARKVLATHGFKKEFRHATGHGVGLSAVDHNALPRLHPKSRDVLETGMVFNVEPAVYIAGYGGVRHCDVVAVNENGAELLTRFYASAEQLWLGSRAT